MKVPLRLIRRPTAASVDAVFVPEPRPDELLSLCRRVSASDWPAVFRVAGGFVVVPYSNVESYLPRTVRLRRLGGELYIPIDAELIPALLPDEVIGLTRDRGLIFLPGDVVLAFDLQHSLREIDLLDIGSVRREVWTPFPPRPERAETLRSIRLDVPPDAIETILDGGKPNEANPLSGGPIPEDARPPAGSGLSAISARAMMATGKLLAGIGGMFGMKGLAAAGANLARKAVEKVPRLSENIFGEHEAALRELLRQFQSGDIEKALRRAPIAVPDPDANPSSISGSGRLDDHDTGYSLRSLLTGYGSGGSVGFLGGADVWVRLAAEYRRLAEEATRRGDARRAAYIYGVLLRDPRSAAQSLDSGGLHRDAAVVYRDRLKDLSAAAAAFERGGCWDEAIALYQQLGHYELAGDLFRRIGDETAALAMYSHAATEHAKSGRYIAAGDLVLKKCGDHTLAESYFDRGWLDDGPESLGCGFRLIDTHGQRKEWDQIHLLLAVAEQRFAPPRTDDAGKFAAYLLAATRSAPSSVHDDLSDRCRLSLAEHLRHEAGASVNMNAKVSMLFGKHAVWPAGVVRDAHISTRRPMLEAHPPVPEAAPFASVRLVNGTVTAVAVSRGSYDIVVATREEQVCVHRSATGQIELLPLDMKCVPVSIAVDDRTQTVVLLARDWYRPPLYWLISWIGSTLREGGEHHLGTPRGDYCLLESSMRSSQLSPTFVHFDSDRIELDPKPMLVRERQRFPNREAAPRWAMSDHTQSWVVTPGEIKLERRTSSTLTSPLPWCPGVPIGSTLLSPPVDWATPSHDSLHLVGVTEEASVYASAIVQFDGELRARTATLTCEVGYRAACLIAPGRIAAVTADGEVHFLRTDGGPLLLMFSAPRRLSQPSRPVFIANQPASHEVIVVFEDGWAVRVPKP